MLRVLKTSEIKSSRKSQFTCKKQDGLWRGLWVRSTQRRCFVGSRTPTLKGKAVAPGRHLQAQTVSVWHRELRPMKGCDLPRATQPSSQLWALVALRTAVQPTQHLSHFLGIACSFIRDSSQVARDHVLFVRQPQHMVQGLPRG